MTPTSNSRELYEALDRIAPELEALSREAEIERRPPQALAALFPKRAANPGGAR